MPSTIASTETTHSGRARTTAASSPMPRTTREAPGACPRGAPAALGCTPSAHPSSAAMASMSARSAMPVLAVAIDDARAVEVIGRQLAAHAITGEDADAKTPHLARHVAEHYVVVVELDAEHGVGQGLDHLALEFDLVLLCHCGAHPIRAAQTRRASPSRFAVNTLKLPARETLALRTGPAGARLTGRFGGRPGRRVLRGRVGRRV